MTKPPDFSAGGFVLPRLRPRARDAQADRELTVLHRGTPHRQAHGLYLPEDPADSLALLCHVADLTRSTSAAGPADRT